MGRRRLDDIIHLRWRLSDRQTAERKPGKVFAGEKLAVLLAERQIGSALDDRKERPPLLRCGNT